MRTAQHVSLYDQLRALPETLTGEILNGQPHTQPGPSGLHAVTASSLGDELVSPFQKGRGGPGGWWILNEPEIHFIRDVEVVVPDLAGWKRVRMPRIPEGHRFEIAPDWVCEILSPSTASRDREIKLPIYARYEVPYAWLIDPKAQTLEALALEHGVWTAIGYFTRDDRISIPPFAAITIHLMDLWA